MEEIARVLDTWSTLANNMRVRDRGIKIIQYGCQMLLGFYSNKLNEQVNEGLRVGRRTASTSRKAFWLLKSISHVNSCIILAGELMQEFTWAKLLDLVEQVFLVIYYFTENIVYFIRVKWLLRSEDDIDPYVNWSWFAGDMACFLSALVRFCYSCVQCNQSTAPNDPRTLAKFKQLYMDILSLSISVFEVLVSADYIHTFKAMFGTALGDGYVGLCGVLSSSLIITEAVLKHVPKGAGTKV
jgi:hypothetical protein